MPGGEKWGLVRALNARPGRSLRGLGKSREDGATRPIPKVGAVGSPLGWEAGVGPGEPMLR